MYWVVTMRRGLHAVLLGTATYFPCCHLRKVSFQIGFSKSSLYIIHSEFHILNGTCRTARLKTLWCGGEEKIDTPAFCMRLCDKWIFSVIFCMERKMVNMLSYQKEEEFECNLAHYTLAIWTSHRWSWTLTWSRSLPMLSFMWAFCLKLTGQVHCVHKF